MKNKLENLIKLYCIKPLTSNSMAWNNHKSFDKVSKRINDIVEFDFDINMKVIHIMESIDGYDFKVPNYEWDYYTFIYKLDEKIYDLLLEEISLETLVKIEGKSIEKKN